jgi:hypothetical protein
MINFLDEEKEDFLLYCEKDYQENEKLQKLNELSEYEIHK